MLRTIKNYNLISSDDKILVAFSAGPDSMALLHLLLENRKKLNITIAAVHVNHQIRKLASKKEEKFCINFCNKNNIELFCVTENIPALSKRMKKGIEETAREFRFAVFETIAEENGFNKIALGHHNDDQIETILFRIIRGSGRLGLRGMPVKRDKIIRPLLEVKRIDVLNYLKINKLSYCEDSSNRNYDYSRNYLRNKLIPEIEKKLNPAIGKAVSNLVDNISLEEDYLQSITEKQFNKIIRTSRAGKYLFELEKFKKNDLWLQRRLLRQCLLAFSDMGNYPDKDTIDRILDLIVKNGKEISLPDKIQAALLDDSLVLFKKEKSVFSENVEVGKKLIINNPKWAFSTHLKNDKEIREKLKKDKKIAYFDLEKISFPLKIRNIQTGDRCRFLGMNGTRKVSDYLIDRKIPKIFRDEIPVLVDKKGIIWLVGHEIADRVKIINTTRKVLEIVST